MEVIIQSWDSGVHISLLILDVMDLIQDNDIKTIS